MNSPNSDISTSSRNNSKIIKNPWPRLAMATVLMVWAGSNMWSAIFRWGEINNAEAWNRGAGMLLTILVTALPMVIGIYLIWSIVVGPDDPRFNRPNAQPPKKSKR